MAVFLTVHRPLAVEAASDFEAVAGGFGQFFQGGRQPLLLQPDGEEAARQLAGFGDGLVQEIRHSPRGLRLRPALGGELALQRVGVKGQADQVLAEPVVNVLANAGLLAVADLEDLALQAVALGDVLLHADEWTLPPRSSRLMRASEVEDRAILRAGVGIPRSRARAVVVKADFWLKRAGSCLRPRVQRSVRFPDQFARLVAERRLQGRVGEQDGLRPGQQQARIPPCFARCSDCNLSASSACFRSVMSGRSPADEVGHR